MILLLGLDVSLISSGLSLLPVSEILEGFASSSVLLENAELADSTDQDEDEANRAHATDLLVSILVELGLILELLPERLLSGARALLEVFTHVLIIFSRLMSSVMLSVFAMVASAVVLLLRLLLFFLGLDLGLFGFLGSLLEELVLLLFSSLELLLEVLEELGQVELLLLEVSSTEVPWLLLERSSDIQFVSNLWIHFLELSLFSEKESIEEEEGKDAVEGSPESDVRVLLSTKGSSDDGSHGEHPHSSRDE